MNAFLPQLTLPADALLMVRGQDAKECQTFLYNLTMQWWSIVCLSRVTYLLVEK